jgi:hypothetical protein
MQAPSAPLEKHYSVKYLGEVQTPQSSSKMIGMLSYKEQMRSRKDMERPRLEYTTNCSPAQKSAMKLFHAPRLNYSLRESNAYG